MNFRPGETVMVNGANRGAGADVEVMYADNNDFPIPCYKPAPMNVER